MKIKDLTGQKFGHLTVIEKNGKTNAGNIIWKCLCICGKYTDVASSNLVRGFITSCGCKKNETISRKKTKHGKSRTRIYLLWSRIIVRCTKKEFVYYKNYGGRGISICDEWRNNFKAFYDWAMNNGYQDDLTIDRINVNGNYEPNNCRWVDMKTQQRNRSNNRIIEYKNKKYCAIELSEKIGINVDTLKGRLKRGWSVERAVNTPVRKWKGRENDWITSH